jgi:hypothetical protein
VEVRKLDAILASSNARINIETPIPGGDKAEVLSGEAEGVAPVDA